jgi:uncharacterized membrane protein YagU involved in acid resistance
MLAADPEQRALRACPWLFSVSTACIGALILLKSPLFKSLQWYWSLLIVVSLFSITMAVTYLLVVPKIWQNIVSSTVSTRSALRCCTLLLCFFFYIRPVIMTQVEAASLLCANGCYACRYHHLACCFGEHCQSLLYATK